jgi:predicted transcriptional regulator
VVIAMAEGRARCLLCGKEYDVCRLCQQVTEYTPWKVHYDSPRHFQTHAIVKDIRSGILTSKEAKERLDNMRVAPDEVKTFVSSVRDTLEPVMKTAAVKEPAKEESRTVSRKSAQDVEDISISPLRGRRK